MLAAAGLLALYALGFLLATIAVALALFLPTWLALLIVTLVLFLIIAILILAGRSKLQKLQAAPPPQAPAEAKTTIATVKDGASRTAKSLRPTKKAAPELGETPAPAASESPAPTTDSSPPPATATPERARDVRTRDAPGDAGGRSPDPGEALMADAEKTPARSPEEITRDIVAEREGLQSAFDSLGDELQQAADAAAEKARDSRPQGDRRGAGRRGRRRRPRRGGLAAAPPPRPLTARRGLARGSAVSARGTAA